MRTQAVKLLRKARGASPDQVRDAVREELAKALAGGQLRTVLTQAVENVVYPLARNPSFLATDFLTSATRVDKGTQILLLLKYKELLRNGGPLPAFDEVGFRTFSQFDEDGILLYIFSLIGTTNRVTVEACAGVGYECNSANLIVNHGWHALLFDGNLKNTQTAQGFYGSLSDTQITQPKVVNAWLDPAGIDRLIQENGFSGEIDLLSVDLDGVDYWIWKAIRCVRPRVVVAEYHPVFGPDEPYTIKNIKDFCYTDYAEKMTAYCGASLAAFVNLGRELGYRLVGCNRNQLNAFFVRDGIGEAVLPEVSAASCLTHPRIAEMRNWHRASIEKQIAADEWERV